MTTEIKVTATVKIDDTQKEYEGYGETLSKAYYAAEKKARAFLRRKNLSVKMDNVVKERDDDAHTSTFTVHDLEVPAPETEVEATQ